MMLLNLLEVQLCFTSFLSFLPLHNNTMEKVVSQKYGICPLLDITVILRRVTEKGVE